MPAQLSESFGSSPHLLRLPDRLDGPLGAIAEVAQALETTLTTGSGSIAVGARCQGPVCLEAGPWPLDGRQLEEIDQLLHSRGLSLIAVLAERADTRVAAAGLGLDTSAPIAKTQQPSLGLDPDPGLRDSGPDNQSLRLHRGTLRAGDHLDVSGSVLMLGDVNPGASIRASGHVLVWGRLRGSAHAGTGGDGEARIVALQLRPLQLRIADCVARGPEGVPPYGLAEEATLVDGIIEIRPASASWPLSD